MCVSYQKMNQVNFPFKFTIPFFDDSVQYIDTEENYVIAVDMYSSDWQVVAE